MSRYVKAFLVFVVAQSAFLLWSSQFLAGQVASKFDWDGSPLAGMELSHHILFVFGLTVVMNLSMFGTAQIIARKKTIKYINVPWRAYWATPDRFMQAKLKLQEFLWVGGLGVNFVIFLVQLLILGVNSPKFPMIISPNTVVFLTFVMGVIYMVWCVCLFKPPKRPR